MDNLDSIFDGMAKQQMAGKGQYLPPGYSGRVILKPLKWNPNGFKGKSCVFEFTLKTSNLASEPVGSSRNWIIKVDATNQYAGSDIKQIMMSCAGVDPATVRSFEADPTPHNEAMSAFKKALTDPSLVEGCELDLQTVPYTTKGNPAQNKPSTVIALHKWSPAREELAAAA